MSDIDLRNVVPQAIAYDRFVTMIKKAWFRLYSQDMAIGGDSAEGRFRSCHKQVTEKMASETERARWAKVLDVEEGPDGATTLKPVLPESGGHTEVDDFAPNAVKRVMLKVAWALGQPGEVVHVGMAPYLQDCLKELFTEHKLNGRFNVGPNRHFSRLLQRLREAAEDTAWENGTGLKIGNASGRGRVAADPYDPKLLRISIAKDYLPDPEPQRKVRRKGSQNEDSVI